MGVIEAKGLGDRFCALTENVGMDAFVHARCLDYSTAAGSAEEEVGWQSETSVPMASLYKIALVACWSDFVAQGRADPLAPIKLPTRPRTSGPTGVAALVDEVTVTQRDAARLAISMSDNVCAEALLDLLGLDVLNAWLQHAGLDSIVVRRGRPSTGSIPEDGASGATNVDEARSALAGVASPRSLTDLLRLVWDEPNYEWLCESMKLQVWRHRIGSAFPHDDVVVAGKTGTLGPLRHEIAVIQYPYEYPVAVAVLTRSWGLETHQPRVDAAIGQLAYQAVSALRRSRLMES